MRHLNAVNFLVPYFKRRLLPPSHAGTFWLYQAAQLTPNSICFLELHRRSTGQEIFQITRNLNIHYILYFAFRALLLYIHTFNQLCISFIHSAVCLTTGPKPFPKPALHTVQSTASSFKWQYPLLSLTSSSSFLRLLPRLPVTSIRPFNFPSITRCRRQFLHKMWPIQLAFRFLISCRIFFCSLTLSNTSSFLTWSVQMIFSILLQHHISKLSRYFWSAARSVQVSAPYKPMLQM